MTKTTTATKSAKPRASRKTPDIAGTGSTRSPAPPEPGDQAARTAATKSATVLALLTRPEGATITAMMEATGWQQHSVRGFLAGTVKKKLGHELVSQKEDAGRVYRIVAGNAAA